MDERPKREKHRVYTWIRTYVCTGPLSCNMSGFHCDQNLKLYLLKYHLNLSKYGKWICLISFVFRGVGQQGLSGKQAKKALKFNQRGSQLNNPNRLNIHY